MASRIAGITVEIGGDVTGLDKALKSVNSTIKNTQSQLKDVERLLKLDPSNTELLTQKQGLLKESITATKEKLDALKTAQEQAKAQMENGDLGKDKYDALEREIVATEQELEKLAKQAAEANTALCKIEEAGKTLENVGNKIAGVGTTLTTKVTVPIAALGTAAVKTAADFDSSMSQVQATMGITSDAMSDLNGESVNTMDSLRDLAKEMGASTAFSASECADAINYLALAGYDTQEIYDTLPTVLNLAAAGNIELASASDMVTDAMSALGMETDEADTMVDQMAKTASSTNTSVAQLGEGILSIGATAKSIKGGTAELNTALGILANNGIKGAEGGTHLRNVILSLQSPTDTAASCMDSLGVSVYDSEGNMRSLNDILGDLNTSMDGMTSAEKANIISTIFNKTDLASVNALLANTGETWDSLQSSIESSAGSAQQMADTQLDNLSGQLTILKSALEGLAISIGEILMPTIRSIVEKIQAFVDKLNGMSDAQKEAIVKIALFAAAIGPVLLVVGKLTSGVGTAMQSIAKLGKGILTFVNQAQLGVGAGGKLASALASIGPYGWLIIAIIALVTAAFVSLWKNNEEFRDKMTAIWEGIKAKFEEFGQGIVDRLNALGFDFSSFTEVLSAVWEQFCAILAPAFEGTFKIIAAVLGTVLDVLTGLFDVFAGIFTGDWDMVWTGIKEIFSGIWNGIVGVLSATLEGLKNLVNVFLGWFGTDWDTVWTSIKDFFVNTWNSIVSFITGVLTSIRDFFVNIWTAISTTVSTVWETIKNVVQVGIMFIQELFSAAFELLTAPFRFIWENCKKAVTTAWEAIKTAISTALTAIQTTLTTVWTAIWTVLSPIIETIKTGIETAWQTIQTTITTVITTIQNTLTTIWTAISTTVSGIIDGIQTKITTAWNAVSSTTSSVMSAISGTISSVWTTITSTVSNAINTVKSTISTGLNAAKSTVSNIFNSIKSAISNALNNAKNTVSNVISAIKSKFNFSWSLPHLKLPHLSISGSFSINPPSVPHFSISWYKKAMENGMILNGPTIFGAQGNTLLAGGEAGSEAVVGTQSLMEMIQSAVANMAGGTTINYGGVNINVYAKENQDIRALADEIEYRINNNVTRRKAALGT